MEARDIYITQYDLRRLKELLQVGISYAGRDRQSLESLEDELDRAHIVEPTAVPHDVVTMNSRVRLTDMDTNEGKVFTLVFPSEAKLEEQKISVLAPIGTAVLGYRVVDTVEWQMPGGVRKLRIEEILYQPEAAGQYNL
jgi:regulator of nucleoside diphosphate kinase